MSRKGRGERREERGGYEREGGESMKEGGGRAYLSESSYDLKYS